MTQPPSHPRTLNEALVLARYQVRLDLSDHVEANPHDDQQRGSTEVEW